MIVFSWLQITALLETKDREISDLKTIQYFRICKSSENFSLKKGETKASLYIGEWKPTGNKLPFLFYVFPHCAVVLIFSEAN